MAKKEKTKPKEIKKEQHVPPPKQEEEEKPFDFGGLPDRDLKKNLGCG